jgi:hypothetical protein
VSSFDLPTAALFGLWADNWVPSLTALAPDGKSVLFEERLEAEPSGPWSQFALRNRAYSATRTVPLRFLTLDVDRIARFGGTIRVPLPARVQTGRLELTRPSGAVAFDGGTVRFRWVDGGAVGKANSWLEWDVQVPPGRRLFTEWVNDRDEGLGLASWSGRFTNRLAVPIEAMALEMKQVTMKDVSFPFLFRDLKLGERPPGRIESLQFAGHDAPIGLLAQRGPKGEWHFKLSNYSNKTVEEVRLTLRGWGPDGKEVHRRTWAYPDRQGPKQPVTLDDRIIAPGQEATVRPEGLWPAGVASVTAFAEMVLFDDGVVWRPPVPDRRPSKAPSKAPE